MVVAVRRPTHNRVQHPLADRLELVFFRALVALQPVLMDLFVLKAKVHSAKVMDYEAIKALLRRAEERFPRLRHLWLDAPATAEKTRARTG